MLTIKCHLLAVCGIIAVSAFCGGVAGAADNEDGLQPRPPAQVAVITTVYHHNSHSDVLASRLFQTDTLDWQGDTFDLELASLYVDQFPDRDTSRAHAETYGFPIYDTIAEALTLGSDELAVDGVLLIAEHGNYPRSETGQTIYPKRRMFDEIVEVFKSSDRVVPIFNDKHVADNWDDAKHIYDTAQEMGIPMIGGSVLPVGYRRPPVDLVHDAEVEEVVALSYGSLDSYGFHGLEMVQSLVERRKGGETGVRAVQCLTGDAIWHAADEGLFSIDLLKEAMSRLESPRIREGQTWEEVREAVSRGGREPVLFHVEYVDGLKATILTVYPQAWIEWAVAWRYADEVPDNQDRVDRQSTLFWTQEARPFMHFTYQMHGIEQMILTGEPAWPIERTLMTSGVLDALLISKQQDGERIETPYLEFEYESAWNWEAPPPPPPSRPAMEQ